MFKEIKYFIFISIIFLFIFFTVKYYFSDINKKNSYRALSTINEKVNNYADKLPILDNDTQDIIEYLKQSDSKKKKKFNFWKLLDTNE